jgi:intein/homing endonuclease
MGEKYTRLHQNWFPIVSSPQLSGMVSDLMCDGHLQDSRWRLDFCSKDTSELRRFGKVIFDNFGLRGKIRECTGNRFGETYLYGVNNKLFSRILNKIGVPSGSKVNNRYVIPSWIIRDRECFREFVRRYFTCEGTVSIEGGNSFIEVVMAKSELILDSGFLFLNQMKRGLRHHFDIETMKIFKSGRNFRKDGTSSINLKLRIKKLEDMRKFYSMVGFGEKRKQDKLKKALKLKG